MKPTVIQISRSSAIKFDKNFSEYDKDNMCWISIHEPIDSDGEETAHISNDILDTVPNLKMRFWDLDKIEKHYFVGKGYETLHPPTKEDAIQLVDFLLEHKGKDVVANCFAGKSRSGAVAQFCKDFLGYDWPASFQQYAIPNHLLYSMMRDYYLEKNAEPIKIIDKRRIL